MRSVGYLIVQVSNWGGDKRVTLTPFSDKEPHILKFDFSQKTLTVDGSVLLQDSGQFKTGLLTVYSLAGTDGFGSMNHRFFYCKILTADGTVIAEYRPFLSRDKRIVIMDLNHLTDDAGVYREFSSSRPSEIIAGPKNGINI